MQNAIAALVTGGLCSQRIVALEQCVYLYRVDSIESLRSIRDRAFRAKNWCCGTPAYRPPHKPFIKLLPSLSEGDGIFQICFWSAETDARSDLSLRATPDNRYGLLRVPKTDVQRAFDGWAEDDDDLIGPHARMYWTRQPLQKELEDFSREGIPLEAIEHCVEGLGWVSLRNSPVLLPESIRMARLGLRPVMYMGLAGNPCMAYWKAFLLDKPCGVREAIIALRHAKVGQTFLQNAGDEFDGVAETILGMLGRLRSHSVRFVVAMGQGRSLVTQTFAAERRSAPVRSGSIRRLLWRNIGHRDCPRASSVHLVPSSGLAADELESVVAELGLRTDLG
jgi:hypothetical protein